MGLDFSEGDAHWSYSGFMRFRRHLAKEIGIHLDAMEGFGFDESPRTLIKWDRVHDPIVPLLDHSDCDGDLSVEECRTIAPRLRELVQGWSDDPDLRESFDKQQALKLADAMDICGREGRRLEFW